MKFGSLTMHFPLTSLDFITVIFIFTPFFQHLLETSRFVLSLIYSVKGKQKSLEWAEILENTGEILFLTIFL